MNPTPLRMVVAALLTTAVSFAASIFTPPPAGWQDVAGPDTSAWAVVDVSTAGITPQADDIAPALAALIAKLERPTVLRFPAGEFKLASHLKITRSGVMLRGDGPTRTRLLLTAQTRPAHIEYTGTRGAGHRLTAVAKLGATRAAVENARDFAAGDLVVLRSRIPTDVPWYKGNGQSPGVQKWGDRSFGQIVVVKQASAEGIEFDLPLALDLDPVNEAVAEKLTGPSDVGIEDLAIERAHPTDDVTVAMRFVRNARFKNLESRKTARYHFEIAVSRDVRVEHCYIHDGFKHGGGGFGYGLQIVDCSTRVAVVDNVFGLLRHPVVIQLGANQCVVAYNFHAQPHTAGEGLHMADFSLHGHYPHHNVYEGNVGYRVGFGDWWGPTGPGHLFYRNRFLGFPGGWHEAGTPPLAMAIWLCVPGQQIIGNDFSGATPIKFAADQKPADHVVKYNVPVSTGEAVPSLPASAVYASRPSFWLPDLPWPAFGPDVKSPRPQAIPAQVRWAANPSAPF